MSIRRNAAVVRRVPPAFLGLSFEYWTLPQNERHMAAFERVLHLLRAPGSGPMTIRIGGDSAEQTFLSGRGRPRAHWAFGVGRVWLRATARVIRAAHLHVILDLNQVSASVAQLRTFAARLIRRLPPGSVSGLELGNEPDLYQRPLWSPEVRHTPSLAAHLPAEITPQASADDYLADADALAPLTRHVFLAGPALGEPLVDQRYLAQLLDAPHPDLGVVTIHEYPFSACATPGQANYPTIARLLSRRATDAMADNLRGAIALARRAHLPVRVTEFNSVTCGGRAGVSNRFDTALWAPGALFEMLRAGVRSADLHARLSAPNGPWRWTSAGFAPRPLLYGLMMFVRAITGATELDDVHLSGHEPQVGAWAVGLRSGRENLLLVNRGARPLSVRVSAHDDRSASVQRLLASGPRSTQATLDGQTLDPEARLVGPVRTTSLHLDGRRLTVAVPAYSAALVTLEARTAPDGSGHNRA